MNLYLLYLEDSVPVANVDSHQDVVEAVFHLFSKKKNASLGNQKSLGNQSLKVTSELRDLRWFLGDLRRL